jgi:ABC-2 type transport system ATP-binding protein
MLATLLTPTAGEATIAGADLRREPQQVRERIGYVPQGGSTDPAETGRGELVIQGRLYGMNKADAQARAAEVLASLDLEAAADRTTGTYSGGMKRRLDVGLGIVHKPSVLFLDEPTTGLDPQARARMWDEIRLLRGLGTTVFLTTHYLEEADALADRLAIIDHGTIVAEGTPGALKAEIGDPTVEAIPADPRRCDDLFRVLAPFGDGEEPHRVGDGVAVRLRGGDANLADVVRALDSQDIAVAHLQLHAPSLDDVFLAKTGRTLEGAGEEESEAEAPEPTPA